uniref:Uncharacterized protein n=1 Tax=Leersia perrieri TaxID=77586 RepID=A0A0D9XZH6_9ORYZ
MDTDGGAVAVEGQSLPLFVTNRKQEFLDDTVSSQKSSTCVPVECFGWGRIDWKKYYSMIRSLFTKHTGDNNGEQQRDALDLDERCTIDVDNTKKRDVVDVRETMEAKQGDVAAAKELESELIKVVEVLHMVSCRELTEYNHKLGCNVTTQFCSENIAFFDLDEEVVVVRKTIEERKAGDP